MLKHLLSTLFIVAACSSFLACNKSENDELYTSLLAGKWECITLYDTTLYSFKEDYTGTSERYESVDPFSWEIRRGFLRTYYKVAPPYKIGENVYNSRGVYYIISMTEDEAEFEQHLYGGFVSKITLVKLTE